MTAKSLSRQRTPLIVGNWKMYKTSREGAVFAGDLSSGLGALMGREVMVAPSFTGLAAAVDAVTGSAVMVAAQDVFWEQEGAYTGEVSARMLAFLRVAGVIVGHSERRQLFGETDETVAKKVRSAMEHGLLPIVCVGETEEERKAGETVMVLSRQVHAGLAAISPREAGTVVIAYEPIWAIGTGVTATAEMAQDAVALIRGCIATTFGGEGAQKVRILYGGSVKPENIEELMAQPDIDGVLVGGASLSIESFKRIIQFQDA